jgi:hypothetical protein
VNANSPLVEPAHLSVPPYEKTFGPEVADLSRLAGFAPDPEQEMALDAIFAVGDSGVSAAFEIAVIACRQNLKTGVFKQAALGWLFVTDERLVVWSAHEFRTAQEAFKDLEDLIGGCKDLSREVRRIHRGNGDEAIELKSGSRLIFKTRTKGGGRGLSGNKVVLDESFALQAMHMGALLPTLSAQPDPQVLYGSSAGLAESAILRDVRDRGRAGGDPRLAYLEWCAPPPAQVCQAGDGCTHARTAVGCGCDDPANWRHANPALGRRISVHYIAAERRALPPSEFGRERMGWWDDPAEGGSPIQSAHWAACEDPASVVPDPVALAFDVAPDRSMAAIATAGRRADGMSHGEVIEHLPGTGWLVDRLAEIAGRCGPCVLVLDPAGPAGAFEKELNTRGFKTRDGRPLVPGTHTWVPAEGETRLEVIGGREYAQACVALADDVANGKFRHIGQGPLSGAVEGARARPLADAWAWSRKNSSADITPLVAVTLARHGHAVHGAVTPSPEPFALWG